MKRICVFCGSNSGDNPAFAKTARELGEFLANKKVELVYGGGRVGLMGIVADSVLENGGDVIGIIPKLLADKEIAHQGLTELIIVESMHSRKAKMESLSDGFIALPGGFGTFEEICEMITWAQLGFHTKPCAFLNIDGYYDSIIAQFDIATKENFVRSKHRELVLVESEIDTLFDAMSSYRPPKLEKWIENHQKT